MQPIRWFILMMAIACAGTPAQDEPLPQTVTESVPLEPPPVVAEVVPLPPVPVRIPPLAVRQPAPAQSSFAFVPAPSSGSLRGKSYPTVLSGALEKSLELGPENSPVLICGSYVILENATLKIRAGTLLHFAADPALAVAAQPGTPDPSKNAVLTVWGTLLCEGVTGNPVEFLNQETSDALVLMYGARQSQIEGAKFKNIGIVQSGGLCLWTNCEFQKLPHYAVAAGGAVFTHCTLRESGGIFATYNKGPWSLLVRRTVFERCREGIVLGSNPGQTRLIIEQNHFIETKGAHIRAMPVTKGKDIELLIGENWYGTAQPEAIEARLVDRRADPSVKARLNTRPPSELPYADVGCGIASKVLALSRDTQQTMQQHIIRIHTPAPAPKPLTSEAPPAPPPSSAPPAALSRNVAKPKTSTK